MPSSSSEVNGRAVTNLLANFKSLDIDDAEILSFLVEPGAKVVIETSHVSPSSDFGRICELQFNQAIHAAVKLEAKPWLEVIASHHIYSDSSFLLERLRKEKHEVYSGGTFYHFAILIQDGGSIDVIAKDFTFVIKKEITRAGGRGIR